MSLKRNQPDPNISLERITTVHRSELLQLVLTNQSHLAKWLPWLSEMKSLEDIDEFIKLAEDQYEQNRAICFLIKYKNRYCGSVSLNEINHYESTASVGYWLGESSTGRGIASNALLKIMNIAFTEMRLNKIEIRCAEKNIKSREIPERFHFMHEANLRQCQRIGDKYVSHAVYSLLASEYYKKVSEFSRFD